MTIKYPHNLHSFAGKTPLYRKNITGDSYPAFMGIDIENRKVFFHFSIDSTHRLRHGTVKRIEIPVNVKSDSLLAWVQSDYVQELIDRLIQGTEIYSRPVNGREYSKSESAIQFHGFDPDEPGRLATTTVYDIAATGFPNDDAEEALVDLETDAILFLETSDTPEDYAAMRIGRSIEDMNLQHEDQLIAAIDAKWSL